MPIPAPAIRVLYKQLYRAGTKTEQLSGLCPKYHSERVDLRSCLVPWYDKYGSGARESLPLPLPTSDPERITFIIQKAFRSNITPGEIDLNHERVDDAFNGLKALTEFHDGLETAARWQNLVNSKSRFASLIEDGVSLITRELCESVRERSLLDAEVRRTVDSMTNRLLTKLKNIQTANPDFNPYSNEAIAVELSKMLFLDMGFRIGSDKDYPVHGPMLCSMASLLRTNVGTLPVLLGLYIAIGSRCSLDLELVRFRFPGTSRIHVTPCWTDPVSRVTTAIVLFDDNGPISDKPVWEQIHTIALDGNPVFPGVQFLPAQLVLADILKFLLMCYAPQDDQLARDNYTKYRNILKDNLSDFAQPSKCDGCAARPPPPPPPLAPLSE
jgi:hypothetical protein